MANWRKKIHIKQYLTDGEDWETVSKNMSKVADELSIHPEFNGYGLIKKLKNIPKGDDIFSPSDYANKLLDKMYDIADSERIWID